MKFEYNKFPIEGGPEDMLKRLNEIGAEGWEVVHVSDMNRESHILSPLSVVWVKRELAVRHKKHDD